MGNFLLLRYLKSYICNSVAELRGKKRFEVRANKPGFHKGDIITINEHQYKYKINEKELI